MRYRAEEEIYCRRFVDPVMSEVELRQVSRLHFARVLGAGVSGSGDRHGWDCVAERPRTRDRPDQRRVTKVPVGA